MLNQSSPLPEDELNDASVLIGPPKITYINRSDNPSILSRTILFTVNDGAAQSSSATRSSVPVAAMLSWMNPVMKEAESDTEKMIENTSHSFGNAKSS